MWCAYIYIGGSITGKIFCYQTVGPITGWAYQRHFAVYNLIHRA